MSQTFWDVRVIASVDSRVVGLLCNHSPLRREQAEKLAACEKQNGHDVEIIPTREELWEATYGDKP